MIWAMPRRRSSRRFGRRRKAWLDILNVKRYVTFVEIESIAHKALRRFFLEGNAKGLDGNTVDRLRKMLSFMVNAADFGELMIPPNYGLHPLTGDRAGVWAMTVTRNWRMTFLKIDDQTIADLDLEDYH